jgi:transposase
MHTSYQSFFGIDIGKSEFVSYRRGEQKTKTYQNNKKGFTKFLKEHKDTAHQSLIVLETTGGYESAILDFLADKDICAHRADNRKVKNFIRSFGQQAKTDALDAKALAQYGYERHEHLQLHAKRNANNEKLRLLSERMLDLKQMLVQEKNRYQAPLNSCLRSGIKTVIQCLEKQILKTEQEIENIVATDDIIKRKKEVLLSVPGIGNTTALSLLSFLPELGTINRKQVASLCGVAPFAKESGAKKYYRRTTVGRSNMRPILFMAAMAASRTKENKISEFYHRLVTEGKKPMVALVATMRKIVVIANARIKNNLPSNDFSGNHS